MADAADSKSAEGDFVRVQVPPPALFKIAEELEESGIQRFFCFILCAHAALFRLDAFFVVGHH